MNGGGCSAHEWRALKVGDGGSIVIYAVCLLCWMVLQLSWWRRAVEVHAHTATRFGFVFVARACASRRVVRGGYVLYKNNGVVSRW